MSSYQWPLPTVSAGGQQESRPAEWIVTTYKARKAMTHRGAANEIAAVYDGKVTVPLPELDEQENAAVANLLKQGLDQTAMRVASVSPSVLCPALVPGNRQSEANARIRRLAVGSWWQANRFDRKERKRARWLIGYAASPVVIRPDRKRGIPIWELRDPNSCYPAPCAEADEILPADCIFALQRPYRWIAERWPSQARAINPVAYPDPDEMYEVLEYIDCVDHVFVVVGKQHVAAPSQQTFGGPARSQPQGAPFMELLRYPNLIGRCTVVNPTRLSLNQPTGQFDQMPALYRMQARAMALWLIATERSIFPDIWFVSRPSEVVSVLERPDGRAGIPGLVKGGDLKEINLGPPPQVGQVIDLLERDQRVTAAIPADYGGENPSNVRTARAGDQLLKATVDYWVQEAQETLGIAHTEEASLAICVAREYFGNKKTSFYVNFKKIVGNGDYTPNVNFDSDVVEVAWPFAGSDANQLAVRIGQKLGLQVMSKRTAMELDPDVGDPDMEEERVMAESLDAALLASIDQSVASGQLGPLEISQIKRYVAEKHMSLEDAFNKVHQDTQEMQQSAMGQMGQGAGPGGDVGGPPGGSGPPGPGGPPGQGPPGLMAPALAQQLGVGPNNLPGMGPQTPTPGVAHASQLLRMLHGGGPGA